MKDIPIIFSGPMIRAVLDDRKTMTRRLAWGGRKAVAERDRAKLERAGYQFERTRDGCFAARPSLWQRVKPGDKIWVKETHYRYGRWIKDGKTKTGRQRWRFRAYAASKVPDNTCVYYSDDMPNEIAAKRTDRGWHKRPSIFMPRWASRLTLIVTATKIERVQEITEADALAEGIDDLWLVQNHVPPPRVASFKYLWNDLHGAGAWEASPEVVALTVTVHKQNIDTLPKAEAA